MRTLASIAALVAASLAVAGEPLSETGVGIASATLERGEQSADLEIHFALDLKQSLQDAVDGGLEVNLVAETRVMREKLFVDSSFRNYKWVASLRRRDYGQGYEFKGFGLDRWQQADSVDAALEKMASLKVTIDDPEVLLELSDFDVYVTNRIEVDLDSLPTPLKVDLMTASGWNFSSGWRRLPN